MKKTVFLLLITLACITSSYGITKDETIINKSLDMLRTVGKIVQKKDIVFLSSKDDLLKQFGQRKDIGIVATDEMFVASTTFPIYINAWTPFWQRASKSQDDAYIAVIAAMLAHELVHAGGERRESVAYAEELRVLRELQRNGIHGIESAIASTELIYKEEKIKEAH